MKNRHYVSIVFICGIFLCGPVAAQSSAVLGANRRTAVRYLQLAKQYATDKQWKQADSQAALGLAYDDSIADLWYVCAVAQLGSGAAKASVLPLITTALTQGQWVDYNRDGARIVYADILASTGKFDRAVSVLDAVTMLYSADAEYIRAKSFYNMKNPDYIQKARDKINTARKIYPDDMRFPLLFFRFEYQRMQSNAVIPAQVRTIADAFISRIPDYHDPDAELEMYAALFAAGDAQVRMLRSFNARSLRHPLYAGAALKAGLIDQEAALSYFLDFCDKSIDLNALEQFVPLITEEKPKKEFAEYLNAYNGVITEDTDGDLFTNLTITYNRGRPAQIEYDKDQDDVDEWTASCDFGVPQSVHLTEGAVDIYYGTWPSVSKAVYAGSDSSRLTFQLVSDTLRWSPFTVEPLAVVNKALGIDFFIPSVSEDVPVVTADQLLHAASSYELPSQERPGAVISVSILNGVPQTARYSVNGVMYAQTQFEKGIPVLRTVDADGDGLFETTETYGFSPDHEQTTLSDNDEKQIVTNLFGSPSSGTGLYVRMIQIDSNGDTVPDFTEEYLQDGGVVSSWDLNGDGLWDTRYVKYAPDADGSLRTDALFHEPVSGKVVTVSCKNNIPVQVSDGTAQLTVKKDEVTGLFWLGTPGTVEQAEKIITDVNQSTTQGVCTIIESEGVRMLVVRIGKMIFGEKLPESVMVEKK